eukprot:12259593-Prorocentrum_lima.AAC.1
MHSAGSARAQQPPTPWSVTVTWGTAGTGGAVGGGMVWGPKRVSFWDGAVSRISALMLSLSSLRAILTRALSISCATRRLLNS